MIGAAGELQVGAIKLRWLYDNEFHLDGGAMFGVVPKVLWSPRFPSDEHNFIPMVTRPILVEAHRNLILIDTGLGNKLSAKQIRNFGVKSERRLAWSLDALGFSPADIEIVILTHLDFDHASGNTLLRNGEPTPAFPNARHIVQAAELEDALQPNLRSKHTYWAENIRPLLDHNLLETVNGSAEIVPGITVHLTGGHTRGHQIVEISSEGTTALHMADLQPTHAHDNPLWVMAYDNYPLQSVGAKQHWFAQARSQQWWITFYHDPFVLAGRWDEEGELIARVEPAKGDS